VKTARSTNQPVSRVPIEDISILYALMSSGRVTLAGVTHEINSALQCLGDSLWAIRDDIAAAHSGASEGAVGRCRDIEETLTVAESALARLGTTTKRLPDLIPNPLAHSDAVDVRAELESIAALAHHQWKHYCTVSVESNAVVMCDDWWVARVAAAQMLAIAIGWERGDTLSPRAPGLGHIRMYASHKGAAAELRVVLERRVGHCLMQPPVVPIRSLDATLADCAARLGGEARIRASAAAQVDIVLRFPVGEVL
jgi:hypothetical protein